jgi:ABC-type nitrate/sulfonate/bicarbonate transport system permease component
MAFQFPESASRFLAGPVILRILSFLIVFGAWEFAGNIPVSPSFPPFSDTFRALIGMIVDGSLVKAFSITLVPLAIGVTISALSGVALGVIMGLNHRAEWIGVPVFIVLQAAPLAAVIPLLILAYGIGIVTKVLIICIMAMPVIVLNSFKAIRHTPSSLIEMGTSFMGSRLDLICKVMLPSATPVIFAGLRLGAAAGFVGAVLSELLVTPTGIGDIITYSQSVAEYPKMYAAIASIIVVSVAFIELLGWIEQRFLRPEKRGSE